MFSINPFLILAETVSPIFMQLFVIVMAILVVVGTLLDIIHKKNVKYFFNNAKKAKLSATKTLNTGQKISVISKRDLFYKFFSERPLNIFVFKKTHSPCSDKTNVR